MTDTTPDASTVDEAIDKLLADCPPESTDARVFWGAQFDAGLAFVDFPVGHGGLGVSPKYRETIARRLTEAGAPTWNRSANLLGIGMGSGVLATHGTQEQMERWLRPMFTMDEIWCQMFSEPGAGSDVAGLSTRAVKDGDEWVVNGQKVWTTLAHLAKWGMLVTRTDPDQPKHKGLTYFIVDMEAEGIDIRPLYQITGEAEFNEVFFDDARIPDTNRIDDVGAGWRVAMTTLMNERVAIGGNTVPRNHGAIGTAIETWKASGSGDQETRRELVRLWGEVEALRLTSLRATESMKAGVPGPEGSTGKLAWADLNKEVTSFTVSMLGFEGATIPEGYTLEATTYDTREVERVMSPQRHFLRARANSIEGGTSEIMRNIVGERVLGLPGEPRVDKDLPWKEVPRG
ncbi:MAG: acyl-CoA dehydrogenase family protein [Acidimicrobiia bacterium]|nr:MAG: acyl-CoA dehydrogenase family protein [Acidimicrobiia bacterium]